MLAELTFACVLWVVGGHEATPGCLEEPLVEEAAGAFNFWSYMTGVPAEILAAMAYHESRYDPNARGLLGEAGLLQVKRNGAVQGEDLKLTFHQLCDVDTNVRIASTYLASIMRSCHSREGSLGLYNRGHGCSPSTYSAGVLQDLRMGRRMLPGMIYLTSGSL